MRGGEGVEKKGDDDIELCSDSDLGSDLSSSSMSDSERRRKTFPRPDRTRIQMWRR